MERAQRLKEPLGLPELEAGEYLIDALFRMGPTRSNGLAEIPTDWDQIHSFAQATGRISEPWEAEVLFDMCQGYCAAKQAGADPLVMAPAEIAKTVIGNRK